ncbi:hypothetical protein Ciccas_005366 [Cichlidogyrus casuarinus]|uniref:Uncharacterized protein n=1 Tax=Cichlidogyrus casuarinus TaxID=1844966 RepID=A0ABD2QCH1_9PLAT
MGTELTELDCAIKCCVANRIAGRLTYSRDFLLSVKDKVASRRSQLDSIDAYKIIYGNHYKKKAEKPRKPEPNKPQGEDTKCEKKDLPEWFSNGPTDFTEEYKFNSSECDNVASCSDDNSEETKVVISNTANSFPSKPITNLTVPVVRTLRDIEMKLNMKPSVFPRPKVDANSYYTLLGIVTNALKRGNCENEAPSQKARTSHSGASQSTINWIKKMRDASILHLDTFPGRKDVWRNQNSLYYLSQIMPRSLTAKQQYLAFLAMQQAMQSRQYLAYMQQQAMLSRPMMHDFSPASLTQILFFYP